MHRLGHLGLPQFQALPKRSSTSTLTSNAKSSSSLLLGMLLRVQKYNGHDSVLDYFELVSQHIISFRLILSNVSRI